MRLIAIAALAALVGLSAPAGEPKKEKDAGAGAGAGAEKPTVTVEKAEDTVILTDGTKLVGSIVAVGTKLLIMIEKDATAERSIERSQVESYSYGKCLGQTTSYKTTVEPDQGLPVISGECTGAEEGAGPGGPGPAPGPGKNQPGKTNPDNKAKPPDGGRTADLSKLWELLAANPTAAQIKEAVAEHPAWRGRIREMLRTGQVPPEGAAAAAAFTARLEKEPELRKALDELLGGGKLQPGAGENPKGHGQGRGPEGGAPTQRRGQEDKPAGGAKEGA